MRQAGAGEPGNNPDTMEQSPKAGVQGSGAGSAGASLEKQSDGELIAAFQKGSEAAFAILVRRYKDPLTSFVYRFLGDWDECNDVVQETFVRLYRSKQLYKPVAKFSTWLYTIATNLSRSALRRRKRRNVVFFWKKQDETGERFFDIADERAGSDEQAESALNAEKIQRALDALPAKYREIIVLRDIQELSYEEIAAITRLNIGTVKSRINRARTQLQDMLKDLWEDRQ